MAVPGAWNANLYLRLRDKVTPMRKSKPLKQIILALSTSIIACSSSCYADIENTNSKSGDDAPPAVNKLVPANWKLEYYASGPLTGKNRKDLVMTVANNPDGAFGNAKARQLLVATKKGAEYKVVARGDHAMQLGMGPAGTDPFVYTSKNQIVTEAFGGSSFKFTENYYFSLINNKWLMTRYFQNGYDSLSLAHGSTTIDVNVLTGHVIATTSADGRKTKRVSFDQVMSPQSVKGLSIPADAPKLTIADANKKCSAVIRSAHSAKGLVVEAKIAFVGGDDEKNIAVFVRDGKGKKIRARSSNRTISTNGFTQTLTFKLPEDHQFGNPTDDSNQFFNWIVQVEQTDKSDPKKHNKFSTESPGSRKFVRGGFLAVTQNSAITIQNANAQNGSFEASPMDILAQ